MSKYSIFHVEGGIGKNILSTSVLRNIKKYDKDRKLVVVSPYPEVFVHNPYIYRNYKIGNCPYFYEDYIKEKDTLVFKQEPYYASSIITKKSDIVSAWCGLLQIGFDENKPELYFNRVEQQNAILLAEKYGNGKPIIAVQINGGLGNTQNHINFNWFRDLPPQYVQPLINKFKDKFTFIQIKRHDQISLNNVVQIDLNIRELFLLLSQCKTAISIDSVTQHVMAVFKKPSIVCWIGNSPSVYGHTIHKNFVSNLQFNYENPESYLEPYALQTLGHQCPSEYDTNKLFDFDVIEAEFEKLIKQV